MSILGAVSGIGHIYNNVILRGANELEEPYPFETEANNIFLQFFTVTNNFIDAIFIEGENLSKINIEFELNIYGGLKKLSIFLNKSFDVKLFHQMKAKIYINNSHFFTGFIVYIPKEDTTEEVIEYKGEGFITQLKKIVIDTTYENKTIEEILIDLINVKAVDTDIVFDINFINPRNVTLTKFVVKNKDILKTIEMLIEICNVNFSAIEYEYGVNKNNIFYFLPIDKTILLNSFFEGYHFQKPEIKTSIKDIVNKINIFRTQDGSSATEYVSSIQDSDSIDAYGVQEKKITYSDYYDQTTIEEMAEYIIERFKDAVLSIEIKNILSTIQEEMLSFGLYRINAKPDNYIKLIEDCVNYDEWDVTHISNTTLSIESYYVYSGRKSFRCITNAGSNGEYLRYEFDNLFWFPESLNIYVFQNAVGNIIDIQTIDSDGHVDTLSINPVLIQSFVKYTLSITNYNTKYIKIIFKTDNLRSIYIDKIEILCKSWSSNDVILREIEGEIRNGKFVYNLNLGELEDTAVDNIKKLNDKTQDIYNIFENN